MIVLVRTFGLDANYVGAIDVKEWTGTEDELQATINVAQDAIREGNTVAAYDALKADHLERYFDMISAATHIEGKL